VNPFSAIIGKERIVWTKALETVLFVIEALFLATLVRRGC
jgi:hypothetical protein